MRFFLMISLCLMAAPWAQAYPEFIGYGYSACITCHFNGQGGGPLSDYGRALWSAEIAARTFAPKSSTDEEIAAKSGFLGSTELPFWLRPHVKYRGLDLVTSPGSSSQKIKYLHMQADVGATIQGDEDGKYLGSFTMGRIVKPQDYATGETPLTSLHPREYYFRGQLNKTLWVYVGLMDKVFGLRNVDHTSYQRTYQGFNESTNTKNGVVNSQGVILQKTEDKWELTGNYFIGNPSDDPRYKQHGFSLMNETEVGELKRLGASFMSAQSDVLKKDMVALHYRQALSKGSAVMFEYGLIQDQATGSDKTTGSYNLVQALVLLTRGYNLKATIERYNQEFKGSSPDQWRWAVGFLTFPMPRLEMRLDFVNQRQFSTNQADDDSWAVEGQIHVSL